MATKILPIVFIGFVLLIAGFIYWVTQGNAIVAQSHSDPTNKARQCDAFK